MVDGFCRHLRLAFFYFNQSKKGEVKTKVTNFDYHNHRDAPPVAARQAEEVARDYLKRAARNDELNGHPPGSDGPMATALKRYNGGRVLVFLVVAFAEMSEDVGRICYIIADDLARAHSHTRGLRGAPVLCI